MIHHTLPIPSRSCVISVFFINFTKHGYCNLTRRWVVWFESLPCQVELADQTEKIILHGATFTIKRDTMFGIMGPSGRFEFHAYPVCELVETAHFTVCNIHTI